MTKYLMRIFREISENYRKIEDLSPGYLDIKKAVESAESKFNRALKKVLNDIKLKRRKSFITCLSPLLSANKTNMTIMLKKNN